MIIEIDSRILRAGYYDSACEGTIGDRTSYFLIISSFYLRVCYCVIVFLFCRRLLSRLIREGVARLEYGRRIF